MDSASVLPREVVIDIGTPDAKVSFLSILVVLFIILSLLAIAAFGTGFFIGRNSSSSEVIVQKQAATTVTKGENTIYTDANNHYSITYPTTWVAKTRQDGVPGVLVSSQLDSVELWLTVKQDVGFSAEQTAAIEKTTKIDITVNGTKTQLTEYIYKAGNYFATVQLPANGNSPLVSFFIKADGEASYQIAKTIVSSFTFL